MPIWCSASKQKTRRWMTFGRLFRRFRVQSVECQTVTQINFQLCFEVARWVPFPSIKLNWNLSCVADSIVLFNSAINAPFAVSMRNRFDSFRYRPSTINESNVAVAWTAFQFLDSSINELICDKLKCKMGTTIHLWELVDPYRSPVNTPVGLWSNEAITTRINNVAYCPACL